MITVVILTKNEEGNLEQLLPTLKWADRVLIVDDYSNDRTEKVVNDNGAVIIKRRLRRNYAAQRNAALKRVKTTWVLFLDADERLPERTVKEVQKVIKKKSHINGYALQRRDRFLNKELHWGETKDTWLTRLGRRNAGRWKRDVHEVWELGDVVKLHQPIIHEKGESLEGFKQKIIRYAEIEAKYRFRNGERWSLWETVTYPLGKFIYNYGYKLGFLDGLPGLKMNGMMSYHSWLIRRNLFVLTYGVFSGGMLERFYVGLLGLTLLALVWGQLTRIQLTPTVAVYGFELLMGLQILVVWVGLLGKKRFKPWPLYTGVLGLFSLVLLVSLLVNVPNLQRVAWGASLYWIRWVFYGLYGISLWYAKRLTWVRLSYARLMTYVGFGLAIVGWVQYLFIPDTRWLFEYGWDDHYYRLIGTILDPGYLGLLLVLTLTLLDVNRGKRWIYFYTLVLGALVLTYARSAYLVYAFSVLVIGVWRKSFGQGLLKIAILLVAIMLLPRPGGEGVRLERTYSIESRAKSVVTAMDLFQQQPVFGVGFNAYRSFTQTDPHRYGYAVHPSSPDSSLALLLATTGIVGVLVWFGWLLRMGYIARKHMVVLISLLVVVVHSLTNNSFFYPFILLWLYFLYGDIQET